MIGGQGKVVAGAGGGFIEHGMRVKSRVGDAPFGVGGGRYGQR